MNMRSARLKQGAHNWVTHLGPIYVATVVFVVGALLALVAMTRRT